MSWTGSIARAQEQDTKVGSVSVTVDTGTPDACIASGVLLGHDEKQAYVAVTADTPAAGAPTPTFYVSMHLPVARRVPAEVLHRSPEKQAPPGLRDSSFVETVRTRVTFDVLGDPGSILPRDAVYVVGCAGNALKRFAPTLLFKPPRACSHSKGRSCVRQSSVDRSCS